ncbi:hypothetical protein L1987_14985 [Smallanthus sonchifolius]|uniref:Uncharacterized protein n=1 Tax=Smallanthus sonchifolius TaxID=185202 RepID=A0ACB9J7T9_9ASTR|nr:hypothetical protein L1987_14985 [Smallanthus sonchifolius]
MQAVKQLTGTTKILAKVEKRFLQKEAKTVLPTINDKSTRKCGTNNGTAKERVIFTKVSAKQKKDAPGIFAVTKDVYC